MSQKSNTILKIYLVGIFILLLLGTTFYFVIRTVKSEVKNKLDEEKNTIETLTIVDQSKKQRTLDSIKSFIQRHGNLEKDLKLLSKVILLCKTTDEHLKWIADLKNKLTKKSVSTNLEPENSLPKPDMVTGILVGQYKNGKAYELKNRLDTYVVQLNIISESISKLSDSKPIKFNHLAQNNCDTTINKNEPKLSEKDFAQANFENASLDNILEVLTEKELKISIYRTHLLEFYHKQLLSQD